MAWTRKSIVFNALDESHRSCGFGVVRSNSGDHRVQYVVPDDGESGVTVAADGVRLDDLIDQQEIDRAKIGLVWIDTQGHEGHVLDSAPRTLAARIPVLIEFCPYMLRRSDASSFCSDS